jgi:HSP20 family protein
MTVTSMTARRRLLPSLDDPLRRVDHGHWSPAVDITEFAEAFILRADLPGMDLADIQVSLHSGTLAIAGVRTTVAVNEHWKPHRVERFTGRFWRTFALPVRVDADGMQVRLEKGVLEITIPKA